MPKDTATKFGLDHRLSQEAEPPVSSLKDLNGSLNVGATGRSPYRTSGAHSLAETVTKAVNFKDMLK